MSEHVLVSPLGFSPGAVSGLAFALIEASYPVSRVITLGTSHEDVHSAARHLENLFHEVDDILYEPYFIPAEELRERDDSTNAFVAQMGLALESARPEENIVHVGVTGGRSGMGALAALATNLYGAEHLWHFWVAEEIEKGGRQQDLRPPFTIDNRYLNPTVEDGLYELVELPFIDLRPLHHLIWEYHKNGTVPLDTPLTRLLRQGQFRRLQDVFPAGLTISSADELIEMIRQYPDLERPEQRKVDVRLGRILENAGVSDAATTDRLLKLMEAGLPGEQVWVLAAAAEDRTGFWQWLQENQDLIKTGSTVTAVILKGLEIWLKTQGFM